MKGSLFVSSVQQELAAERRAVRDFVRGDALLGRFFEPFLGEDLPARERRADGTYLDEIDRAAMYVGLFGDEYADGDGGGASPTEREFERAAERGKPRLVFIKGAPDRARHPRMRALIDKAGAQLVRHRFNDLPDLTVTLRASLVEHLLRTGAISSPPFDAAACPDARIGDLSADRLRWFLETARRERAYPLDEAAPIEVALTHLNLLDLGAPSRAAVLLFGRDPQRFLPSSEVQCLHLQGTEAWKGEAASQVCKGTAFDLVDQALGFVMSRLEGRGGHELPRGAVAEAIVNAVVHRDYARAASVRVQLFADRLEVRTPGALPTGLAPADLLRPHPSIPPNPLLAEPLFLARLAERPGTGTLDMLAHCRAAALSEPEFRQEGEEFVTILWRAQTSGRAHVPRSQPGERRPRARKGLKKSAKERTSTRAKRAKPVKEQRKRPVKKRSRPPALAPKRRKKATTSAVRKKRSKKRARRNRR